MTPDDLEAVVARTGHERFRELTSSANPDVVQRDGYRALVARLASVGPPSPPSPIRLAETIRAAKLGYSNCWFSAQDDECGCSGVKCHLLGRIVSLRDCVDCLKP